MPTCSTSGSGPMVLRVDTTLATPGLSSSPGGCVHVQQPGLESRTEAPDTPKRTGTAPAEICACRECQPENAPEPRNQPNCALDLAPNRKAARSLRSKYRANAASHSTLAASWNSTA